MKAYILIHIQTGEIVEALDQLRAVKGVQYADMTFGEFDAIAIVEAADLKALGRLVAWDIQTIPGIQETITCLAVGM